MVERVGGKNFDVEMLESENYTDEFEKNNEFIHKK